MPAKRTPAQREADLLAVSGWYVRGWTQQAMVERLNQLRREYGYSITQSALSRDLAEIRRRWVAGQIANFDQRRAAEVAKIDNLERVYWEQFEASQRPEETTSSELSRDGVTRSRLTSRTPRMGNLACLAGVQWCIDRRIKLFGLEARELVDEMVRREAERIARDHGMNVDDVLREAQAILKGV